MKKIMVFFAVLIGFTTLDAHAVTRSGRDNQNVIVNTGDSFVAYKVTVGTITATSISAYSGSKARLVCRNSASYEVFIGSHVNITSSGVSAFELGAATSTYHVYDTYNIGALFAIGRAQGTAAQAAITGTVYCIEER